MEDFILPTTITTPEVSLNIKEKIISFNGISAPENVNTFYNQIETKLSEFFNNYDSLTFDFNLEYFNSSSSKRILNLLILAKTSLIDNDKFKVIWRYEKDDEEILDSGKLYEHLSKLPFVFIEFI